MYLNEDDERQAVFVWYVMLVYRHSSTRHGDNNNANGHSTYKYDKKGSSNGKRTTQSRIIHTGHQASHIHSTHIAISYVMLDYYYLLKLFVSTLK